MVTFYIFLTTFNHDLILKSKPQSTIFEPPTPLNTLVRSSMSLFYNLSRYFSRYFIFYKEMHLSWICLSLVRSVQGCDFVTAEIQMPTICFHRKQCRWSRCTHVHNYIFYFCESKLISGVPSGSYEGFSYCDLKCLVWQQLFSKNLQRNLHVFGTKKAYKKYFICSM